MEIVKVSSVLVGVNVTVTLQLFGTRKAFIKCKIGCEHFYEHC